VSSESTRQANLSAAHEKAAAVRKEERRQDHIQLHEHFEDHLSDGHSGNVPNNAVIIHKDAVQLMSNAMMQRGIKHTTSECTLRGFTCAGANVDPKTATPAEIAKIRKIQIGYQVDGITGGLAVKDKDKSQK
jgi:hypothetical protein